MPNGSELNIDLSKEDTVNTVAEVLSKIINYDLVAEGKAISDSLAAILDYDKDLRSNRPDLYNYYQKVFAKCRWVALGTLSDEEIIDLFQTRFLAIFEEDINLWNKLKEKLVTIPLVIIEDRDALKKKIGKALHANSEVLTPENIKRGERILPGTVGSWLADYDSYLGAELVESVKFSEYLVNSPNTKKLSTASREKLRKLFNFYEKIKASSTIAAGAEEMIDFMDEREPGILMDGVYYRADLPKVVGDLYRAEETIKAVTGRPAVPSAVIAPAAPGVVAAALVVTPKLVKGPAKAFATGQLRALYMGSTQEQKKVAEWEDLISKATAGAVEKLSKELVKTINVPLSKKIDKEKVIALLRLLIKSKKIDELIYSDLEINKEVGSVIKDSAVMEHFKVNPRDPTFVKMLIHRILVAKTLLNESESARIAAQLSALAQKIKWEKGTRLAYFDVNSNSFKWL